MIVWYVEKKIKMTTVTPKKLLIRESVWKYRARPEPVVIVVRRDIHRLIALFAIENGLTVEQSTFFLLQVAFDTIREQYPDLKVPRA